MCTNIKSKNSLHGLHDRRVLVFVSLLIMTTLASSCFVSVFTNVYPFTLGTPNKTVNNETDLRNAINNAAKPIIVALDKDIRLSESLIIPYNKDITLTSNSKNGFYKLIGANGMSTVDVEKCGVLKLEGVIVTHTGKDYGNGVFVNFGGTLYLYDGAISNNVAALNMSYSIESGVGGGVFNSGSFSMFGGEISNNTARAGGGVFNNGNDFNMYGGKISNNTAYFSGGGVDNYQGKVSLYDGVISNNNAMQGGGVFNVWNSFVMSGGMISNNVASDKGGGVYNYYAFTNFSLSGGEISNNTAPIGGGVCTDGDFNVSGGKISSNTAKYDGGGVYVGNGVLSNTGGVISDNTAPNGNNVYTANGNDSSGLDSRGYSLMAVLFICVCTVGLTAGVVTLCLFFYFRKRMKQVEAKFNTLSQDKVRNKM